MKPDPGQGVAAIDTPSETSTTSSDKNDVSASELPHQREMTRSPRARGLIDTTQPEDSKEDNSLSRFIGMCHFFKRFERLSQIKIEVKSEKFWDDEMIFSKMRQVYMAKRGYLKRWFSWYRLRAIHYVKVFDHRALLTFQFELFYSDLVSIQDKCDDASVGSTLLFHYFKHPHHGRGSVYCRNRIRSYPQKLTKRLADLSNPSEYGLRYVERLLLFWPLMYGLLIVIIGGAFGVAWYCITDDLSAGFTVTSACYGILTLLTMIIAAFGNNFR